MGATSAKKGAKTVAKEMELKKANEAILRDRHEREQAAIAEFNKLSADIAKKWRVNIAISEPRLTFTAQ